MLEGNRTVVHLPCEIRRAARVEFLPPNSSQSRARRVLNGKEYCEK